MAATQRPSPDPMARRSTWRVRLDAALVFVLLALAPVTPALSQPAGEPEVATPDQAVAVEPDARDEAIQKRIARILNAAGWYRNVAVVVDEGIVFLDGVTALEERQQWARDVARRTEDVVAVVNRIAVREEVNWDLAPVLAEVERLARKLAVALPLILLAVLILPLTWWLSSALTGAIRRLLAPRVDQDFLRDLIARAIAIPVFLLGIYIVLQIAGLTGLAVSLLGGAGIIGIVLGFAFRDIAENFLASLFLSVRRPFQQGDVIAVADHEGVVQTMNTRSTILLTIDGNHVQIPNATVFKSTIVNYTAAPARRVTAEVGIGYDDSIADAQEVIVAVLRAHEAILHDPPPMVLVDALGASTVNLGPFLDRRPHPLAAAGPLLGATADQAGAHRARHLDAGRGARDHLSQGRAYRFGCRNADPDADHAYRPACATPPNRRAGGRDNGGRGRPRQRDRRLPSGDRRSDHPRSHCRQPAGAGVSDPCVASLAGARPETGASGSPAT